MLTLQNRRAGFTLIELVMVIVILGILAATALPRFVDLRSDANTAAAQGFAGALNAANSVNYASCAARGFPAATVANVCIKMATCSQLGGALNPAITFVVGAVPATTTQGSFYLAADSAATATGTSCAATYGDGSTGRPFTYTATAT